MQIKVSTDWSKVEGELRGKARKLANARDVLHLISNIEPEIRKLSQLEVEERRTHKCRSTELLESINNQIEMVEGFLLVAALIG